MSSSRGVDENSVDPTRHLEIHHWRVENEDVTSEFFFVHRLLVMKNDLDVRTSFCLFPSTNCVFHPCLHDPKYFHRVTKQGCLFLQHVD